MRRRLTGALAAAFLALSLLLTGCGGGTYGPGEVTAGRQTEAGSGGRETGSDEGNGLADAGSWEEFLAAEGLPAYAGQPYEAVNGNEPFFSEYDFSEGSFESYSDLDGLGRCGQAFASVGQDLMPTEDRESIGQVKPTGWQTVKYEEVDGKYLYNRCHLIGFQLTGENANEKNLITGTRYLNVEGMLPFENMVADYVKETGNHVLYRVTPKFFGEELVARGVLMEAESVEDGGEGIRFCVFAYNVQPGIAIDYETGESRRDDSGRTDSGTANGQQSEYVLNTNTKKFHLPGCSSVKEMDSSNRQDYSGSREELLKEGYEPCGRCRP